MEQKWQCLDLSMVKGSGSKPRWFPKKPKLGKVEDYVSIRHGFRHLTYCCAIHSRMVMAYLSYMLEIPQEEMGIVTLKREDQAGVPIKYDLFCPFKHEEVKVKK